MKIAVDARELRGKPTGVGRFLDAVLAAWKTLPEAHDHEVVLLAPVEHERGGTAWEQFVLPRLVRTCRADVLLSPAYSGPLRPPVPMVVVIHDASFFAHPEWFRWREGARRRVMVRLASRAATRIVTISEFSKRELAAHLDRDEATIAVAYPGATTFTGELRHSVRDDPSRRTVLFVGSIFNRRHIPQLIEGFARLARRHPEVHLDMIGDNRTSPSIDVGAAVSAAACGDRIRWRHYVTDEDLRTAYACASAFAFLSDYEGFGLTPLEAMASDLPVLLLDTPVGREVFGEAACYIAHPDPTLIEGQLERLLFDTDERIRLVEAGRHVSRRYSWDTCARQILHVLVESTRG